VTLVKDLFRPQAFGLAELSDLGHLHVVSLRDHPKTHAADSVHASRGSSGGSIACGAGSSVTVVAFQRAPATVTIGTAVEVGGARVALAAMPR